MYSTLFSKKADFSFLKKLHLGASITKVTNNCLAAVSEDNELKTLNSELHGLSKSIGKACADAEPEFIEIGQQLQEIYQKTSMLSSQVIDSVKHIDGKNKKGLLDQMRQMAGDAINELDSCQKEIHIKTNQRKMVMGHLDTLSKIFSEIEKIGMLLKIVGININIESSRSEKSFELFSVVATETIKLSEKIRHIAEDSKNILDSAIKIQQDLFKAIFNGSGEIEHLGYNAQKISKEAVADIETLMTSSLVAAEQAGNHSEKINQKVGDLVVAIQFHDSMSQRLDHIIKALCDALNLFSGKHAYSPFDNKGEKTAHGFSILTLQNKQLKEIISDIEHVYRESLTSFEMIFSEIDSLINLLSDLKRIKRHSRYKENKSNDPFKSLKMSFENLAIVLCKSHELLHPERQAANRVSETVEQISKVVSDIHSIGFETHLMAMNAIVKAAHLGQDGGALEILAHEVKKTSDQSMVILEQTDTLLAQITDASNKLQHESADDKTANNIMQTISQISDAYDAFIKDSFSAGREATEIKETILKIKSSLYFLPSLAETLSDLLFKAEKIVAQNSPDSIDKISLDQKTMGNLLGRYTMARERKIHGNAINDPPASIPELPKHEHLEADVFQSEFSEKNLGENVELF